MGSIPTRAGSMVTGSSSFGCRGQFALRGKFAEQHSLLVSRHLSNAVSALSSTALYHTRVFAIRCLDYAHKLEAVSLLMLRPKTSVN